MFKGKKEYQRISLVTSSSDISTVIEPKDKIIFLGEKKEVCILLNKKFHEGGMQRMDIKSEQGESLLEGQKFTLEDVRLIVVILAACFRLSFKEQEPKKDESVTFEFH